MSVWYHGTNPESAARICSEGIRIGTYLARQRAVAEHYGRCVFAVELEDDRINHGDPGDEWQLHTLEVIPPSAIVGALPAA